MRFPGDLPLLLGLMCGAMKGAEAQCSAPPLAYAEDPSPHRSRCLSVRDDLVLELLDWGGSGPPLLFLSGLGDTAHEFDEFAPRFTDRFHVMAITRRGFGRSTRAVAGYDLPTLAGDVALAIDSLHLADVTLIGHSFGGDEMSWVAANAGGKVARLIYLDAAHDRTQLRQLFAEVRLPGDLPMTAADSASPASVRAYLTRSYGIELPVGWTASTVRFGAGGRYAGPAAPDSLFGVILAGIVPPEYPRIAAPALLVYAVPDSARDLFAAYPAMDAANRRHADSAFAPFKAYILRQITTARLGLGRATVVIVPRANHYVFVSHRELVEREMRAFLATP